MGARGESMRRGHPRSPAQSAPDLPIVGDRHRAPWPTAAMVAGTGAERIGGQQFLEIHIPEYAPQNS
jgi:hypothetical protein